MYPESDNPGELLFAAGEQWLLFKNATWLHEVILLRLSQIRNVCSPEKRECSGPQTYIRANPSYISRFFSCLLPTNLSFYSSEAIATTELDTKSGPRLKQGICALINLLTTRRLICPDHQETCRAVTRLTPLLPVLSRPVLWVERPVVSFVNCRFSLGIWQAYPSIRTLGNLIDYLRNVSLTHTVSMNTLAYGAASPPSDSTPLRYGAVDGFHPEFSDGEKQNLRRGSWSGLIAADGIP